MIKAIIVDDELVSRQSLNYLLSKMTSIEVVDQFSSAIEAQKFLENESVDVIFLDVEMPELTGIEFLTLTQNLPQIVLTTTNPNYAVEAFEHKVLDYLVKPVNLKRLSQTIERLQEKSAETPPQTSQDEMYIKADRKFVRIELNKIAFVETMDDYLVLHMIDGSRHITHSTLASMEKKLSAQLFQKVHRSYIVNLSQISSIEEAKLNIGKHIIPISRAYRPVLKERLGI